MARMVLAIVGLLLFLVSCASMSNEAPAVIYPDKNTPGAYRIGSDFP